MNIQIFPSKLLGAITPPPSKSVAHRAIICSALSSEPCKLHNIQLSDDIKATLNATISLGKQIKILDTCITLGGVLDKDELVIDCGESGSTLRFMLPIVSALGKTITFVGRGKLPTRPIYPIINLLEQNGGICSTKDGLPLTISGKLHANQFEIRGDLSSQYITGLLFSLPLLQNDGEIILTSPLQSKPYVNITIDVLKSFGICITPTEKGYFVRGGQKFSSTDYHIESDYSNAAFFLAAGAIMNNAITLNGLNPHSFQGDKRIVDSLKEFGANVGIDNDKIAVNGGKLHGISIDAADIPDLVPILSVIAVAAKGTTLIYNAERLRIKESDRLHAICDGLIKMGADIEELSDKLVIRGGKSLHGGCEVLAYNDHRIAMSMSIAALLCKEPVTVFGAECINKSYPTFYEDFNKLGGISHELNMG